MYTAYLSVGKQAYLQRIATQAAEYANELAVVYGDVRAQMLGQEWLFNHVRPGLELMVACDLYRDAVREIFSPETTDEDGYVGGAA